MEGRDKNGLFLPGNRFWEVRSSCGANPKFDGPEMLWAACQEYFHWNEENPLYEAKAFSSGGTVIVENLPKMRAMTVGGLCMFLDISQETWCVWRKTRADLSEIIARVDDAIRRQKFEGASADMLNANIIARDLGLADKQEHTGKDGADLMPTDKELARRLAFLLMAGTGEADK